MDLVVRARGYLACNAAESGADILIDELASEIERLRSFVEWRPIETAPKDGTEVLTCHGGFGIGQMVLYFMNGMWREKANGMGLKREPTHWLPLPSPPESKT